MPWIENVSLGDIPKGRHHTINGVMLDSGLIVPKNYEGDI